jgi:ABC-type glycerol-3-phosphate transport system substrate-binding protein
MLSSPQQSSPQQSSPEHKRPSDDTSSAAVVTPEKSVKKQRRTEDESSSSHDDSGVTAETVMGFPSHPYASNGEIMKNHHGFVVWAKKKSADGDAQGRLEEFVEWVESPEGQRLELEIEGDEKFTFGQHRGETFTQVAQNDPGYHGRYLYVLRKKGEEPNEMLSRYISWFQKSGYTVPSLTAAARRPAATSRRVELGSECFESGGIEEKHSAGWQETIHRII